MKTLKFILFAIFGIFIISSCGNETVDQKYLEIIKVEILNDVAIRVSGNGMPGAYPEAIGFTHVITNAHKGETTLRARAFDASGNVLNANISSSIDTLNNTETIAIVDLNKNGGFDYTAIRTLKYEQYNVYIFKEMNVEIK